MNSIALFALEIEVINLLLYFLASLLETILKISKLLLFLVSSSRKQDKYKNCFYLHFDNQKIFCMYRKIFFIYKKASLNSMIVQFYFFVLFKK